MRNIMRTLAPLIVAAASAFLAPSCTSNTTSIAGGTSIPNQIVGTVFTPQGTPAQGARVVLFSDTVRNTIAGEALDTTFSDRDGGYVFTNIKQGRYAILATAVDSSFIAMRRAVAVAGSGTTVSTADTMVRGGGISGVTGIGAGTGFFIQIYNTHYQARIDAAGNFSLAPLPPGTYIVLTLAPHRPTTQTVAVHIDTAVVVAGAMTALDSIRVLPLAAGAGPVVLDDFEDGDAINALGSWWWTFTDAAEGGSAGITPGPDGGDMLQAIASPGAQASASCAHVKYRLGSATNNYAGFGCNLVPHYDGILQSRDLSGLKRVSMWLRGTGAHTSAALIPGIEGASNVTLLDLPASPAVWTLYSVAIDSLLAASDSAFRSNWNAGNRFITQFDIIGSGFGGPEQELWIDEVTFEF